MDHPELTRRWLLQGFSLAALAGTASAFVRIRGAQAERDLLKEPVEILSDYLGMHLRRWPEGVSFSPAPSYGYGAVRSHDYSGKGQGICWASLHTAPGVFEWSAMGAWVGAHGPAHKTLMYTVYGLPAWLAPSTAHKDAYYGNVGCGPPVDGSTGVFHYGHGSALQPARQPQYRLHRDLEQTTLWT